MIHVIRSALHASVHLVCDGCGEAYERSLRFSGPDRLAADRLRLRIWARLARGWSRRMLLDGEASAHFDGDLCRQCRHHREALARPGAAG